MPSTSHWRSIKQHVLSHGSSRPFFSLKHSLDTSLSDSREASTSVPAEGGPMLVNIPRTTEVRETPGYYAALTFFRKKILRFEFSISCCDLQQGVEYGRPPSVPSSTLVELTTRLDFFKERRSQLMEQLHSLDLGHGSTSHGFPFKPSSPWNSPR